MLSNRIYKKTFEVSISIIIVAGHHGLLRPIGR